MSKTFNEQVAIVTGGNSGIGQATALDLAKQGAKVMILSRNEEKNKKTIDIIRENGGYAEAYPVDVSDQTVVNKAVNTIYDKHGRIDILVANAGNVSQPNLCHNMDDGDWDKIMKVHLYGTFYCVKACARKMKEKKYGRIVLMSSLAGVFGLNSNVNYATAKTGIIGMTYTLAKELGPYGITVNAVQPGVIRTPIIDGIVDQLEEPLSKQTPVRRIGEPEDVANAIVFFCEPKNSFITGEAMKIDGGYILNSGMDEIMRSACES